MVRIKLLYHEDDDDDDYYYSYTAPLNTKDSVISFPNTVLKMNLKKFSADHFNTLMFG